MILAKHVKQSFLGMTLASALVLTTLLSMVSIASAHEHPLVSNLDITNLQHPDDYIFSSGQPEKADFSKLKEAGVQTVVNLRPHAEQDWNEQEKVESLGMSYINLPVAGADGVTFENAKKLDAILKALEGKTTLLHCSSSNRVGALVALSTYQKNGNDIEAAITAGKKWGLTRLEPLVREKLAQ